MRPANAAIATIVVSALGALASVASAAETRPAAPPPMQRVNYADVDLTRRSGVETLYKRLRNAAHSVCSSYDRSIASHVKRLHAKCIDSALSNAVSEVGHPALTDRWLAANGRRPTERAARIAPINANPVVEGR